MNCLEWEERVALHAGGDLGETEAAEVERHLVKCAECRVFVEELRASVGVLQEAHREEVSPAHYAAVRARVLGQLERRRRPRWAWVWAGGAVAAAAVIGVLVFWGSGTGIPAGVDLKPTQARMPVPLTPARPAVRVRRARRAMPPKPAAPAVASEEHEPLVVKLLTDDPNVVIYWITSEGDD